jgi:hypothetical protein
MINFSLKISQLTEASISELSVFVFLEVLHNSTVTFCPNDASPNHSVRFIDSNWETPFVGNGWLEESA